MQKIWEKQWESFAMGFKDGYAHIPTSKGSIRLLPGPGFGDGSHPSTLLLLDLMVPYLEKEIVVDMGSGSGILALAAAKMGAKKVIGVEIDPDAISHARKNAQLNKAEISFFLPTEVTIPSGCVVVMNMISSEQKEELPRIFSKAKRIITSGLLSEEESAYRALFERNGYFLEEKREEKEWASFSFLKSS